MGLSPLHWTEGRTMRLILLDRPSPRQHHFYPLALGRPIWELRSGMTSLGEKLVARLPANQVACFVTPYLAEVYRRQTTWPVNDVASLAGDNLLLVDSRAKLSGFEPAATGPSQIVLDNAGDLLWARIAQADLGRLPVASIDAFLAAVAETLPRAAFSLPAWQYIWELVAANPDELAKDFRAAGRRGIEGTVEEPVAIRGSRNDIHVAPRRPHPSHDRLGCRTWPDLYRPRGGNPALHADRGPLLHRPQRALARGQLPQGQHDRARLPRRRRGRALDPARLREQGPRRFPRPRLCRPVGQPRRGHDQQRPEE